MHTCSLFHACIFYRFFLHVAPPRTKRMEEGTSLVSWRRPRTALPRDALKHGTGPRTPQAPPRTNVALRDDDTSTPVKKRHVNRVAHTYRVDIVARRHQQDPLDRDAPQQPACPRPRRARERDTSQIAYLFHTPCPFIHIGRQHLSCLKLERSSHTTTDRSHPPL